MFKMEIYKDLGIKRIINCFDTYTLLGGHTLFEEVCKARDEADKSFAWIWDIQKKAGERIAELTGAEAAFIPVGVYAGIAQCIAALMVGTDPIKMRHLPDTTGLKNEVVMQRCLRDFQYDRSITTTGAKIIEVGDEKKGCTVEQIESSINEKTVAIHFMSHGTTGNFASKECRWVPVEKVIEIGHKHNIPVIVDAAFQCYPLDGFKKFIAMGADAALYSCKYFGGPNTAGILLGRRDLIEAVAMHSFIGQEGGPRGKEFLSEAERGSYGSLFRGCKQDRASIVGAVVAFEKYNELMSDTEKNVFKPAYDKAEYFMREFKDVPDIEMQVIDAKKFDVDPLKVALQITLKKRTPEETIAIRRELMSGDPEIWIEAKGKSLILNITSFRGLAMFTDKEKLIIANRIKKLINLKQ
jgi:D-glucosaminate-6-phosphate ammonia-lyase